MIFGIYINTCKDLLTWQKDAKFCCFSLQFSQCGRIKKIWMEDDLYIDVEDKSIECGNN